MTAINRTEDGLYEIHSENRTVFLTVNEVSLLVNFCGKEGLRSQINDRLDEIIENGDCDLEKYDGTREEFVQEVFEQFEDKIDYGESVDDCDIDDEIYDLINIYDLG